MLGTKWSYAKVLLHKCDESFVEAGLQVILQTFILMTKQWKVYRALFFGQQKGYYQPGNVTDGYRLPNDVSEGIQLTIFS